MAVSAQEAVRRFRSAPFPGMQDGLTSEPREPLDQAVEAPLSQPDSSEKNPRLFRRLPRFSTFGSVFTREKHHATPDVQTDHHHSDTSIAVTHASRALATRMTRGEALAFLGLTAVTAVTTKKFVLPGADVLLGKDDLADQLAHGK